MQASSQKIFGFTLIEMMIVLIIMGVLVAVAVPSYRSYVMKSRRADAQSAILDIQLEQEKYRANNITYGTLAQVYPATTTEGGYYNLTVTGNSATGYVVTATAVGTQANDAENGTACAALVLTVAAGTDTRTPAACWQK